MQIHALETDVNFWTINPPLGYSRKVCYSKSEQNVASGSIKILFSLILVIGFKPEP